MCISLYSSTPSVLIIKRGSKIKKRIIVVVKLMCMKLVELKIFIFENRSAHIEKEIGSI